MQIKNKKHMTIAIIAIVPAILFGGLFMAESFTNSDVQVADAAMPEATMDVPFTTDENGNKHYTVELTENISITDSVEVISP